MVKREKVKKLPGKSEETYLGRLAGVLDKN